MRKWSGTSRSAGLLFISWVESVEPNDSGIFLYTHDLSAELHMKIFDRVISRLFVG